MDALLRELREGPDGIAEYYDTEITSKQLTIGSAADRNIQLLGRGIAPEHAVIVLGQPSEDFASAIGRPIIDDNDFELDASLCEQVTNGVFNS